MFNITTHTRSIINDAMILFRSLPPAKQQLIEKAVTFGEISLDPTASEDPADHTVVVEKFISVVARDSST